MTEKHCTIIATELGIPDSQIEAVEILLAEGGTVPFIARYRKERTGSLDEVQITTIRDRLLQLAELDKRGVAAVKQRARIEARMAAAKAKAATPKAKKEEVKKNKPRGKGGNLKRGRKDGHKHQ